MNKKKKNNSSDDIQLTLDKCFFDIRELREIIELKESLILKQKEVIDWLKERHHEDVFKDKENSGKLESLSNDLIRLTIEDEKRTAKKFNESKKKALDNTDLELIAKLEVLDILLSDKSLSERAACKEIYKNHDKRFCQAGIFEDFESFKNSFNQWYNREFNQIEYPKINEYLKIKEAKKK